MLDLTTRKPMVGIGTCENIVEIKDRHIVERVMVLVQPILEKPLVESPRVFSVSRIGKRRRSNDNEEFIRPAGEVLQNFIVNKFGVANGKPAFRVRWIIWIAFERRIWKAGLEHDDLVLASRIIERPRVIRILSTLIEQRVHKARRVVAGEPFKPIRYVGAVANPIGPPAIVGITDEVVILAESQTQAAIAIAQPVLPCGVVDKDKFDDAFRRTRIIRLAHQCGT